MNSIKKRNLPLKKGDVVLIVSLCLIVLLSFLPSFFGGNENLTVEIYHEGELTETLPLSEEKELTVGDCTLLIEKDGVTFIKSDCPDKLCIKRGKLKRKGDTMACVPEKVVAVIKGEKKDDFHIATY